MADVLKTTNWWSANPPAGTVVDISGSGVAAETRLWTAAEAHDALDATYEALTCGGDGFALDGNASLSQEAFITAAAGGIKFLRLKYRARAVITGVGASGSGSVDVLIGGSVYGFQVLTGAFVNYTVDFTVDPVTGLAWTPAAIAAKKFGLFLRASAASATFRATVELRVAEFTVEVWGQDVAGTIVGASADAVSAAGSEYAGEASGVNDARDPQAVVAVRATLDSESAPVTLRSANATLNDQSLATKLTNTGTNSSGTFVRDLGGLQGATAINGTGLISGVRIVALVRASKSNTATLGTFRFGTAMGLKALVADPTVYDFDAGLNDTMWSLVQTALIATGAFGAAFDWGNGINSVWANFVSPTWDFRAAWVAAITKTAQIEVAEAWVEVHGPAGSQPVVIELTHALNLSPKVQALSGTL